MDYRIEKDSMGEIMVPSNMLWGAQTQRSLQNFNIGIEKMPTELIKAFILLKVACANANRSMVAKRMTEEKHQAIINAAEKLLQEDLCEHFPLSVWQTGSGTQTNMNVNECITNLGNSVAGYKLLHPNDDVNMSQSSNDTFPTAMHISAVCEIEKNLIPAVCKLIESFKRLESKNNNIVKCGRTHLQDATPITFAQEISGWRASLEADIEMIILSLKKLRHLAIGATAVGTGINAPSGFDRAVCYQLTKLCGTEFYPAENKFHALTSKDELVFAHGALKALATDLMKIANDIRWLASGPRLGLSEISIPENEPGSSIMPGKVNPTQCEAVTMVAVQVMANDVAVGISSSQGNFELNVFMPVCIYNFLQSVRLLTDVCISFEKNCVSGIVANVDKMNSNLKNSLMLVTALTPYIGYEKAADVAKYAYKNGKTLKESCVILGYLTEEEFDKYFVPSKMVGE